MQTHPTEAGYEESHFFTIVFGKDCAPRGTWYKEATDVHDNVTWPDVGLEDFMDPISLTQLNMPLNSTLQLVTTSQNPKEQGAGLRQESPREDQVAGMKYQFPMTTLVKL